MRRNGERVQKYMARCGVGSRRHCEELIRQGRVRVGGHPAELGMVVEPGREVVTVDGRPIRPEELEYWLLNKPAGVVCTASDPEGRPTVVDMVPARGRVYPVGRLDWDTTGLVLLTNDGELAVRLTHPRYSVEKEYVARIRGEVTDDDVQRLRTGVPLSDGMTAPAHVSVVSRTKDESILRLVLHEGRNRQVRRMVEAVGHSVLQLHRSRIDGLSDQGLAVGRSRPLAVKEVRRLRAVTGLTASRGGVPVPRGQKQLS